MSSQDPINNQKASYREFLRTYVGVLYRTQSDILNNVDGDFIGEREIITNELWVLRYALVSWWLGQVEDLSIDNARAMALSAFEEVPRQAGLPKDQVDDFSDALIDGLADYWEWHERDVSFHDKTVEEAFCFHFAYRVAKQNTLIQTGSPDMPAEWILKTSQLADVAESIAKMDFDMLEKQANRFELYDDLPKVSQAGLHTTLKAPIPLTEHTTDKPDDFQSKPLGTSGHRTPRFGTTQLVIAGSIVIVTLMIGFYWYQIRPSRIRQNCQHDIASSDPSALDTLYGGYNGTAEYHIYYYQQCLASNGLNN